MKKIILGFLIAFLIFSEVSYAVAPAVRVKDLAKIMEVRDNQLVGFGLVVGLKNTGDSTSSSFTRQALANLLTRMGIKQNPNDFRSRNVAAVMVTADLPPFIKPGQRIDIKVSSIGDANSLKGGNLVQTPLQGADGRVYAVAQGSMIMEATERMPGQRGEVQTTTGFIVQGALVENIVPVDFSNKEFLTLVLHKADFTTAQRLAETLSNGGIPGAKATDAQTVRIPLTAEDRANAVNLVAKIEDFLLIPDAVAKVVINQKTGVVVIGENVRLAPVAISYSGIEVKIEDGPEFIPVNEHSQKLVKLEPGASLTTLVSALNTLGVATKDLVAILQSLKSSGALSAEIEVL